MTAKALGVIEAIGLAAAIEAADAAAKAANVVVLGYDNAKGGGRIAVKLAGDVGAVRAAVSAGSAAALHVGKVAGCIVVPRPHEEIAALVAQVDRGRRPAPEPPPTAPAPAPEPAEPAEPEPAPPAIEVTEAPAPEPAAEPVAVEPEPSPEAPLLLAPPAPEPEKARPPVRRGKPAKNDPRTS